MKRVRCDLSVAVLAQSLWAIESVRQVSMAVVQHELFSNLAVVAQMDLWVTPRGLPLAQADFGVVFKASLVDGGREIAAVVVAVAVVVVLQHQQPCHSGSCGSLHPRTP